MDRETGTVTEVRNVRRSKAEEFPMQSLAERLRKSSGESLLGVTVNTQVKGKEVAAVVFGHDGQLYLARAVLSTSKTTRIKLSAAQVRREMVPRSRGRTRP